MPLLPGDTFDRYTIEAVLGEGGMGTVYRAWDPRLHRRVALKVLRADRALDVENATDAAARMTREARAAAALEHANCVAIFDVGEHRGTRFIAMEYVDGASLRRFVGDATVPLEQKVRWLVDVARALSAAHRRGLIHRDVKPENVMVRNDGTVKVLDFGIAKRAAGEGTITNAPRTPPGATSEGEVSLAETAVGTVSGTPLYMAPEQLRQEPLDARTDQWAWGVVAYEVLTGLHPFRSRFEGSEFLVAILNVDPAPPSQLVPHLPAVVEASVLKALAKAPHDRFASMDHVVSALEPFAGSTSGRSLGAISSVARAFESVKTELAMPVDPRVSLASRAKRHGRLVAGGAALALGAAVAVTIAARDRAMREPSPLDLRAASEAPGARGDEKRGLAITEVEPPVARSAAAGAAYAEGLHAFRAATFEPARQAFARATAIDPAMASAHLRLALLASLVASETEARQSFRRAVEFRASLPPRDAALVDAFEPYLSREPSDVKTCAARLAAAVAKRPEDAELRLWLGIVQFDAGDVRAAEESFAAAIDLDADFAEAWSYLGATQAFLGELDRALGSFDRCLEVSIGATDCLWYRVLVHDDRGECAAVEADARSWIAKSPDDPYAYHTLARALYALGRDVRPVRAALEQAWAHEGAATRDRVRLADELKLDLLAGDFARATARGAEYEGALASEPSAAAHGHLAALLAATYEEMGRTADAARVAAAFLDRKEAWVAPTRVDDVAISTDFTPEMLAVEAEAGTLSRAALDAKRTDWLRAWAAKTSPTYYPHLWVYGYATPARTEDDAKGALDALPRYQPLPAFFSASLEPEVAIGRVFLLAGRAEDATAPLARATRSCLTLDEPLGHVRAELLLGRAREKVGDRAAACAAYGAVVKQWSGAKPRSRSADEARAAIARLACAK